VVPCRAPMQSIQEEVDTDPLSADDTLEDIDPSWAANVDLDRIDAEAARK
jgi:hypothetical protein